MEVPIFTVKIRQSFAFGAPWCATAHQHGFMPVYMMLANMLVLG